MNEVIHIVSKEKDYWKKEEVEKDRMYEDTLELTGEKRQEILGFGGCFNELGWDALQKTKEEVREGFLKELYGAEGCAFNMGRVPIGANDFSLEWYSCDDTDGDYELKDFNVERDKKYTVPFIRAAQKYCPDLTCLPMEPSGVDENKEGIQFWKNTHGRAGAGCLCPVFREIRGSL